MYYHFSLLIFFLTFIESILDNVNDVVCLSFLSNKSDTYIFYNNDSSTIKSLIYFSVTEDYTIVDQRIIIISNIKLQIILPKQLLLDLMNTNYAIFPVLTTNTICL